MRNHPATVRLNEHVSNLREKPQHVRENIALFVSGGFTLLVFFGWLGVHANNNTFALTPTETTTTEIPSPAEKVAETKNNLSSLLGAAGAATTQTPDKPAITIMDEPKVQETNTESNTNPTVIHF